MEDKILDFTDDSGVFDFKAMAARNAEFIMAEILKFFQDPNYEEKEFAGLSPDQQIVKRCKLAWIREGAKEFITYVDKETMKAYRTHKDNYNNYGPELPLDEIVNYTFIEFVQSAMQAQAYGF